MSPSPRKSRRSLSRSLKERRASQKPDHLRRESGVAVGGRELRLERAEAARKQSAARREGRWQRRRRWWRIEGGGRGEAAASGGWGRAIALVNLVGVDQANFAPNLALEEDGVDGGIPCADGRRLLALGDAGKSALVVQRAALIEGVDVGAVSCSVAEPAGGRAAVAVSWRRPRGRARLPAGGRALRRGGDGG